ncbi:S8 family serine peptidase [Porphyromonas sp.]|uniref:S8 family serine peptidase n=1 Tax=Porphyromonas sp. TaxID=1924944 RepID=UPI0026DD7F75|nr:S8 family serine peptidase [Porphyromonas sp.]MDO4770635.1 S8 family serine peptidase [Porphyromonas sp.]
MNNKYILLTLLGASVALGSCRQDDLDLPTQDLEQSAVQTVVDDREIALPNVIRVRFANSEVERIELLLKDQQGSDKLETSSVPLLEEIKAVHMERVFPHAGKYEERTRRAGLHLWYDITLEDEVSEAELMAARNKAMELADKSSGVTATELVYVPKLPQTKVVKFDMNQLRSISTTAALPMNDPMLSNQWHYHNDGSLIRSKAGADINLFEAWKKESGKSEVIVSVVDGGIDFEHEDLKDNMYINEAELRGVAGKDDDGNGHIDDVYGYNFYLKKGTINAIDHGTHVAGTVAARNNNGIGVCGVAGGNGEAGSGVKLMSCQTFDIDPKDKRIKGGGFAQAIKYGADNGAVISQNSWGTPGTTRISPSTKEAIDYFIKNAGCDTEGNQLPNSPMKGGVVIFAAGNEGTDYAASPAAYTKVISVSAMSTDFRVSPYSNRGDWVTIMAPGGDIYQHKGQVLSTLPNNEYGYMQGTSMACPHVSGVAALIVSKFGGQGFTAEELTKRLKTAISSVDINEMNPEYAGRLGVGYIDANIAISGKASTTAPDMVRWEKVTSTHTGLDLTWHVAGDEDDQKAFGYNIYMDKKPLTKEKLAKAHKITVTKSAAKLGETIDYQIKGLSPKTRYYLAIEAYDRWGNVSEPAFKDGETLSNHNPVITVPDHAAIRLSGKDTYDLTLSVSDPDGHKWTHKIAGPSHGVTVERVGDELKLHFRVVVAQGSYTIKVVITDELGGTVEQDISFEVYQNVAPKQIKQFEKAYLPMHTEPLKFDLDTYFSDANKDALKYSVRTIGAGSSVAVIINESNMTVKGANLGRAALEITATDPKGMQAKAILELEVVQDELVHIIYPTPVSSTLNIRFASRLRSALVKVFTPSGEKVLDHTVNLPEGQPVSQLDVRSLSTGTYILHVEAEGKEYRQSFIKR